jgi:hypothetical protein
MNTNPNADRELRDREPSTGHEQEERRDVALASVLPPHGARHTRVLKVALSPVEIIERALSMAQLQGAIEKRESERQEANRCIREGLRAMREEVSRMGRVMAEKAEPREVACEVRWTDGRMDVVRLDTGEVIESRSASDPSAHGEREP